MAVAVKRKRVRATLSQEDKAIRRGKLALLTNDLALAKETYITRAKEISNKHHRYMTLVLSGDEADFYYGHRSMSWTSRALYLGGKQLRKRRSVNVWNAFVSRELHMVNDGKTLLHLNEMTTYMSKDLAPGLRYKLPGFLASNRVELQLKYSQLSAEDRQILQDTLLAMRAEKAAHQRCTPKAMQKDVDATFEAMDLEVHCFFLIKCILTAYTQWQGVSERTGIEGFYMAVRTDIEHYHQPKQFFSTKATAFFEDCLKLDPERVALQFEAWCVGGPDKDESKPKRTAAQEISECHQIIQERLSKPLCLWYQLKINYLAAAILSKYGYHEKLIMNYDNYERKVVEEHSVELRGWVTSKVTNPGKMGTRQTIRDLLLALQTKQCRWVKLTGNELTQRIASNAAREAAGEQVYKRRKKPTNKLTKTGGCIRSSEFIDDGDDE
jgi:hypothetical protein